MKKVFNKGDKVIIIATKQVKTVVDVVKAAYYCYYLEGEDGYRCDCDLIKL